MYGVFCRTKVCAEASNFSAAHYTSASLLIASSSRVRGAIDAQGQRVAATTHAIAAVRTPAIESISITNKIRCHLKREET